MYECIVHQQHVGLRYVLHHSQKTPTFFDLPAEHDPRCMTVIDFSLWCTEHGAHDANGRGEMRMNTSWWNFITLCYVALAGYVACDVSFFVFCAHTHTTCGRPCHWGRLWLLIFRMRIREVHILCMTSMLTVGIFSASPLPPSRSPPLPRWFDFC